MAQFTDGKDTLTVPDALAAKYAARGWKRLDKARKSGPEVKFNSGGKIEQPDAERAAAKKASKRPAKKAAKKSDPGDDFDTLGPGSVTDGVDD